MDSEEEKYILTCTLKNTACRAVIPTFRVTEPSGAAREDPAPALQRGQGERPVLLFV
jgi:hypothetical protein